mmetsp:Transcript_7965/g.12114  ORF Transcript_7965/g.12114 Transcript_7965/m.12114 type:complete len:80 (+) Transcript_7965:1243-1482(+)
MPWASYIPDEGNSIQARLHFPDPHLQQALYDLCAELMGLPATSAGLAQAERRIAVLLHDHDVRGNANRILNKLKQVFYF